MRWTLLTLLLLVVPGCGDDREGDESGECSDGADNDHDGAVDCDDEGCAEAFDCIDTAPTTTTSTGSSSAFSCVDKSFEPSPQNGAGGVSYRSTVEVLVDFELDGTEAVYLEGVTGESAIDGDRVVFTPAEPLQPLNAYNAVFDWACGPSEWVFSTGEAGPPIADPASLVGGVYRVSMTTGRWVEPVGLDAMFTALLEESMLLGITGADATELMLAGGLTEIGADAQNPCSETFDFPDPADFSENPRLQVQAAAVPLDSPSLGGTFLLEQSTWIGDFTPDADAIVDLSVSATMDMDALSAIVLDDMCALLPTLGVDCGPCPGGGPDACIRVVVDQMEAPLVSVSGLAPTTADDVLCNPDCGTPPTGCP